MISLDINAWAKHAVERQYKLVTNNDDTDEDGKSDCSDNLPPNESWVDIGAAFRDAAVLYCISSLYFSYTESRGENTTAELLKMMAVASHHRASLLAALRRISSATANHHRKLIMWPLMIAGITASPHEYDDMKFIQTELIWISRNFGTASAVVAHTYLSRLWSSGRQCWPSAESWDSLFDQAYIFAL